MYDGEEAGEARPLHGVPSFVHGARAEGFAVESAASRFLAN